MANYTQNLIYSRKFCIIYSNELYGIKIKFGVVNLGIKDAIEKAIADDTYLIDRKSPTEAEQQLLLKEVSFCCPLCGKDLRNRKQKKNNKLYEIAHIFPNSPTVEQYERLSGLKRLGDNSEAFENKIALCKDCHAQQDYHTTQEDYIRLLQKKQQLLKNMELWESTISMEIESEIAEVIQKICNLDEEELIKLNYSPVKLVKKFTKKEVVLKNLVTMYVTNYYPYIRELFKEYEGVGGFRLKVISLQIKTCFTKMEAITSDKSEIFNKLVEWLASKTGSSSKQACEAVISFFVQNCEVFYEIS